MRSKFLWIPNLFDNKPVLIVVNYLTEDLECPVLDVYYYIHQEIELFLNIEGVRQE